VGMALTCHGGVSAQNPITRLDDSESGQSPEG
jgi:hypothetical protein